MYAFSPQIEGDPVKIIVDNNNTLVFEEIYQLTRKKISSDDELSVSVPVEELVPLKGNVQYGLVGYEIEYENEKTEGEILAPICW